MKAIEIQDTTLIGRWEDVENLQASAITKNYEDTERLNGILVYGYEMKFGKTNENGERYSKEAFDEFLNNYFVKNKLNLPVDLQHSQAVDDIVGRVIYAEVNSVGLYFVAYIPRTMVRYEQVRNLLSEGILQGFSKYGYATEYEYKYTKDGDFDYMAINRFDLLSVSLVTTPANSVKFEKVAEVKNALRFENKNTKKKKFFKQ